MNADRGLAHLRAHLAIEDRAVADIGRGDDGRAIPFRPLLERDHGNLDALDHRIRPSDRQHGARRPAAHDRAMALACKLHVAARDQQSARNVMNAGLQAHASARRRQ